jgi:hypothetical protein
MAKFVLKGQQVAQLLSIVAKEVGSDSTLDRAGRILGAEQKKDIIVIFTDNFGNVDVKPA